MLALPAVASANHGWHQSGLQLAGVPYNSGSTVCWIESGIYHVNGQHDLTSYSKVDCTPAVSYIRTQCWNSVFDGFTQRGSSSTVLSANSKCEGFNSWGSVIAPNGSPYWWNNAQQIITVTGGHTWGGIGSRCQKNSNTTISCSIASPSVNY